MNEEKKTYAPGTVTISSEEYRDILTEAFTASKAEERANDKYWEMYRENAKLKEQVAMLEKELDEMKKRSEPISPEDIVAMMTATVKGR